MKRVNKKDKKNKRLLMMYLRIVLSSVLILSGLFWLIGKSVVLMTAEKPTGPSNIFYDEENVSNEEEKEEEKFLQAPAKTNFLFVGVDKDERLTDVMMVGSFDRDSQMIDIISIPRDTYTEFSSKEKAKLKAAGINAPDHMKMNSVHSYTFNDFGVTFLEEHLEELLGIEIDYYAKINIKGFRELIDAIGGVEFDVPINMNYDDPYQDLHIHLNAGYQTLNGEQAEGLVRFRKNNDNSGYPMGDLQRIQVQQDFMKVVFEKVLSLDGLITNPIDVSKVFFDNVETNFTVVDLPKYVPYISGLSPSKFNMYTMPYDAEATDSSGYVIPDVEAISELVNVIFYSDRSVSEETSEEIYNKKIQVLNGSRTNGLASKTSSELAYLGFNVADFGNYNGDYRNETVIKVKPGTNTTELEKLFDNPVVEYSGRSSDTYDVVIILGLEEEGINMPEEVDEEEKDESDNS